MTILGLILYPLVCPLSLALLRLERNWQAKEYKKWDQLRGFSIENAEVEKWTPGLQPQPPAS